ncbi:MAG: methylenetetrahydrofolate reductase [Magnetococcales bacterium]|nr:methylenetetrahydrofolate reductase [Magnetococcales bacterium]
MKAPLLQTTHPTRISIELVPRDAETLREELRVVRESFASVNVINLPDLPRFPLRSWDGCAIAKAFFPHTIPHIRALDIPVDAPLLLPERLRAQGIGEILLVTGDPPAHGQPPANASTVLQAIRRFKEAMPELRVYAALDPYRQGFQKEYDYLQQKLAAGADGVFSQPFFDLRLMEMHGEMLAALSATMPVFFGVSPVTSETSRAYWEKRNQVPFPRHFEPTLAWNQAFARQALAFARSTQTHIYFMPIRTNVVHYLEGILS